MTFVQVALDYSRPIQSLFEQATCTGHIHSVFSKALNIVVDDTTLALLSSEVPRVPNGIRLPAHIIDELSRYLYPNIDISIGNGRLMIPDVGYTLRLPQAPAWEPRPELSSYQWCRATVAQHVHLLAQYLAEQPLSDGLAPLVKPLLLGQDIRETPLTRRALPALCLLLEASRQQNSTGVEEATRQLAGLGPGLTPSGDDTLAGFAGVMALLSPHLSADAVPRDHIASTIARVARPRTTFMSATLLAYAARGEMAEHIGALLTTLALPAEASTSVLQAAERILTFGAYSGGDTLLGLLLGLRALETEDAIYKAFSAGCTTKNAL